MARIRRRKGNRSTVKNSEVIALYMHSGRVEGRVVDTSDSGLGVFLAEDYQLRVGQTIKAMYQRIRRMAKVMRVESTDDGINVGLQLID